MDDVVDETPDPPFDPVPAQMVEYPASSVAGLASFPRRWFPWGG